MSRESETKNYLPQNQWQAFDDIVEGRVLGASTHIRMIGEMIKAIAHEFQEDQIKECVKQVCGYFIETRGKSSYAIITACNIMMKPVLEAEENVKEVAIKSVENYIENSKKDTENILEYTKRLCHNFKTVMIFDYSSTVEKAICHIQEPLKVYVPESRAIDGGKPFVNALVKAGHQVHVILDAAMLSVLDECDAAFIGAETFYPDGTAFNTIGSDILAELCYMHNVPYYVLTPLLKVDVRSVVGIYKQTLVHDLKDKIAENWTDVNIETVDFEGIELVGVNPKYITGYVCENGIIPTYSLYQEAIKYNDRINGGM